MDSKLKNVTNYVVHYNCFIKHQFTEYEGIYINKIRNLNRNDKKNLERKNATGKHSFNNLCDLTELISKKKIF